VTAEMGRCHPRDNGPLRGSGAQEDAEITLDGVLQ
jgi:hypothetical protein